MRMLRGAPIGETTLGQNFNSLAKQWIIWILWVALQNLPNYQSLRPKLGLQIFQQYLLKNLF